MKELTNKIDLIRQYIATPITLFFFLAYYDDLKKKSLYILIGLFVLAIFVSGYSAKNAVVEILIGIPSFVGIKSLIFSKSSLPFLKAMFKWCPYPNAGSAILSILLVRLAIHLMNKE